MKKVLVVGLGGSGGKTICHLMDESLAQIKDMGWDSDKLPDCWSFVHIDVPGTAGAAIAGDLHGDVVTRGGNYIGISSPSAIYKNIDITAFEKFKNSSPTAGSTEGIRDFLKWRPDPDGVAAEIDITGGAGAFRGLGRALTIASGDKIADQLESAISKLMNSSSEDGTKLAQIMGDGVVYAADESPLILLVSSMAGGTGSSMILDVADIINGLSARIPRFLGRETAAFLYTADVFKSIEKTYLRAGSQTLAAVSELLHAQTRGSDAWTQKEWRQIVPTGIVPNGDHRGRGPKVIFPVGASVDGKAFGEKPMEIYRGFSRVLAPILVSNRIQDEFYTYVLVNWPNEVSATLDKMELISPVAARGAAVQRYPAMFGGFGSATLSTGRDRYKEYAAQRIARRAAEILFEGFEQAGADGATTRIAKIQAAASRLYPRFAKVLNFDDLGGFDATSLQKKVLSKHLGSTPASYTDKFVSTFAGAFANGSGINVQTVLTSRLRETEPQRQKDITQDAKAAVLAWAQQFTKDIQESLMVGIAEFGVTVADELLNLMAADLQKVSATLKAQTVAAQNAPIMGAVSAIGRINGAVTPANPAVTDFNGKVRTYVMESLRAQVNKALEETIAEFQTTILASVRSELSKIEKTLQSELGAVPTAVSSAAYREAPLVSWPKASVIPSHFNPAANEVLLTPISSFVTDFDRDIVASISGSSDPEDALNEAAKRVIARRETVLNGVEAKYGAIQGWKDGQTEGNHPHFYFSEAWRPVKLDPVKPANPRVKLKLEPSDLHSYAHAWLDIVGNPFELACRLSISSWLATNQGNTALFAQKLSDAITLASPLVELDQNLVTSFHGATHAGITYDFSAMPVDPEDQSIINIVKPKLVSGNKGATNWGIFTSQCKPASMAQVVSISGRTSPYIPWASKSLTDPVNNALTHFRQDNNGLGTFWTNMRARTLSQFVPLAEDRILSFLRGWIIGRLTGRIQTGVGKHGFEVKVFRDKTQDGQDATWLPFSSEVIGADGLGISVPAGGGDSTGWNIPAILLESLPLALSKISSGDTGDWAPYAETIRLGNSMYSIPGMGLAEGTPAALDNWLNGYDKSQQLQSQLAGLETVSAAKDWVSTIVSDMRAIRDNPINESNFWKKDAIYEIIDLLEKAALVVGEELSRPNLGIVAAQTTVIGGSVGPTDNQPPATPTAQA